MPQTRNKAVIWDMDGVIVDSFDQHFQAWQTVFRRKGVNFTVEDFRRTFGQRNDTIIRDMMGNAISRDEIEAVNHDKQEMYREIAEGHVRALPGAIELIKSLKDRGFKLAVASSGPPRNIEMVLRNLNIDRYFDAVVSADDVTEGKPNPQCFLLAARKLDVAPEGCIVIEDAVAGVAACKNAGMRCVAVTTTHPSDKLKQADLIVDSLKKISVSDIMRLLAD
ncbi:MAG: HAD family phosphatase [Chloroflexi bacterium]|nr:HAD family phosphatase [Chloroflexota bacterium]